jgi:hypothetical protein
MSFIRRLLTLLLPCLMQVGTGKVVVPFAVSRAIEALSLPLIIELDS